MASAMRSSHPRTPFVTTIATRLSLHVHIPIQTSGKFSLPLKDCAAKMASTIGLDPSLQEWQRTLAATIRAAARTACTEYLSEHGDTALLDNQWDLDLERRARELAETIDSDLLTPGLRVARGIPASDLSLEVKVVSVRKRQRRSWLKAEAVVSGKAIKTGGPHSLPFWAWLEFAAAQSASPSASEELPEASDTETGLSDSGSDWAEGSEARDEPNNSDEDTDESAVAPARKKGGGGFLKFEPSFHVQSFAAEPASEWTKYIRSACYSCLLDALWSHFPGFPPPAPIIKPGGSYRDVQSTIIVRWMTEPSRGGMINHTVEKLKAKLIAEGTRVGIGSTIIAEPLAGWQSAGSSRPGEDTLHTRLCRARASAEVVDGEGNAVERAFTLRIHDSELRGLCEPMLDPFVRAWRRRTGV